MLFRSLALSHALRRAAQPAGTDPSTGSRALSETRDLRSDVERLLLITEALWGILQEKHGLSEADLARRIEDIDLKDGRLDGRLAPAPPLACPGCGKILPKHRPACLYCGAEVAQDPFQR